MRTAEFSFGCGRIEFRVEFGNELSPKKFASPLVLVSGESNELEEKRHARYNPDHQRPAKSRSRLRVVHDHNR